MAFYPTLILVALMAHQGLGHYVNAGNHPCPSTAALITTSSAECAEAAEELFPKGGCYGQKWAQIVQKTDDPAHPKGCFVRASAGGGCGLSFNPSGNLSATCSGNEECQVLCRPQDAIVSEKDHELPGLQGEEGLREMLKMAAEEPEALMELMTASGLSTIVPTFPENAGEAASTSEGSDLPFVLGHGMGDSCFNPGMKSITAAVGKHAGVYSTCIPTGDTQASDSNNGFFMNMNKNVEVFAQKIKADPKLANGFYCIGFSQGNNLCRGYIQMYNDPPVKAHLSVHGPVAGVAGFPNCNPSKNKTLAPLCDLFASFLDIAYTEFMQNHLFQGNYYRDPRKLSTSGFKKYSQIAQWNNEGDSVNATFKTNFEKTKMYVMVEALKDTMVYPNEGEHWGQFTDGGFKEITTMKDTEWYKSNLFGLQTIDAAGGIFFETTPGNHLQFTETQLFGWLDKYILKKGGEAIVV